MKVNRWLVLLLVCVGLGVGAISLYTASLSGVMGKMGLVGGDFRQSIKNNELARLIMVEEQISVCGIWSVAKRVPAYLVARDSSRVEMAGELGSQRVECGVRLVHSGNVERGVYTIIKGLYYLKGHYTQMRGLVEQDRDQCKLLTESRYEPWVEGYLRATEGRVHEVVIDVYKQVENSRARVEELCIE